MNITVPQLAEGVNGGTVVGILVKEGETIAANQDLVELETDKAIVSVPSEEAGRVTNIMVSVGDSVTVGQVLLSLEGDSSDAQAVAPNDAAVAKNAPTPQPSPTQSSSPTPKPAPTAAPPISYPQPAPLPEGVPPPASPSLRKMCAELGIDLRRVAGSGAGGRISREDVRAYIASLEQRANATPSASDASPAKQVSLPNFASFGPIKQEAIPTLRRKIAEKMALCWETVPHVTQFDEADLSRVLELRAKYKKQYEGKGLRLTVTALLAAALLDTLKNHSLLNDSLDMANNQIIHKEYIHLGIAVDTPQGLIVPVIKNADKLSIAELSGEIDAVAEKARSRTLGLEQLQGATFTISNQGGIGGGPFTPIVNTPETAILGLAQTREQAVVREGEVVVRPMLPISLSYDHRLVDGGRAVRFVVDLVKAIEDFNEQRIVVN